MSSISSAQSESFGNTPTRLLRGAKQGDLQDMDGLLAWFQPYVFAILRNYGLNDDDAREVFQNVFVTLLQRLPVFERERNGSFRKYLSQITRSRVIDHRRERLKWQAGGDFEALAQEGIAEPDYSSQAPNDPETLALVALVHREVERVIATCSAANQEAFRRVYLNNEPQHLVREELGLRPDAMYQSFSRILKRLRASVGDQPFREGGADGDGASRL